MEIKADGEYRTVSGKLVNIYKVYPNQQGFNVHGSILQGGGFWSPMQWDSTNGFAMGGDDNYNNLVPYNDFRLTITKFQPNFKVKQVEYFGNSITIPTCVKYLVTDNNGDVRGFVTKPVRDEFFPTWKSSDGVKARFIGNGNKSGNWKHSLQEV